MLPFIHFNPDHVPTYTAERPFIRTILCLAANLQPPIRTVQYKSASLHEWYKLDTPVYVSQTSLSDRSYRHNCHTGILEGNLYGTPPASHIYFEALTTFLTSRGYRQTDSDPSVSLRMTPHGQILISATIDDFLIAAPHKSSIDTL